MAKKSRKSKRYTIAILYHFVPKDTFSSHAHKQLAITDNDTILTVQYVEKVLLEKNFRVQKIQLESKDLSPLKKLKAHFIFNLVDSKELELKIAKLLRRFHIPHSGSASNVIAISNNKVKSKNIFTKHALPIPPFTIYHKKDRILRSSLPSKFPLILKPACEHGSVGIGVHSVVTNFLQLQKRVKFLRATFHQPIVCEQYIYGKELQVTVLERGDKTVAMPIAEMIVKGLSKRKTNKWNIYGFAEKWHEKSTVYKHLHFIAPARGLTPSIEKEIRRDTIRAFYAFGFRDYARFDIRYNIKDKKWYFLEGNANPGFCNFYDDALTASINAGGMTLDDFVIQIIKNSLPRLR